MSDTIIEGMAAIFWGDAWASHVEEHRCANLSGCEITECMPPIPELAYRLAHRVAGRIEARNGTRLANLFYQACKADGIDEPNYHGTMAERFGNCLAWMAMSAGVSWFDDHEKFPIKIDDGDADCGGVSVELQIHAEENCQ